MVPKADDVVANERMYQHLAVSVRNVATSDGPLALPTLYSPALLDGVPEHVPLDIDFVLHGLDRRRPSEEETGGAVDDA